MTRPDAKEEWMEQQRLKREKFILDMHELARTMNSNYENKKSEFDVYFRALAEGSTLYLDQIGDVVRASVDAPEDEWREVPPGEQGLLPPARGPE